MGAAYTCDVCGKLEEGSPITPSVNLIPRPKPVTLRVFFERWAGVSAELCPECTVKGIEQLLQAAQKMAGPE